MTKTAKYTDEGQTSILWNDGNSEMTVPNDMGNRHRRTIQEWVDEGNTITEYVAPPAFATAGAAKAALVDWVDEFTAGVTGPVPKDEKLSWDAKEAAAKAHLAGTADAEQTALLQGEADLTGESLNDLSTAIITKATTFRAVVGKVAGLRRAMTTAIDAESDPYGYETILNNGKAQALAMAAALGL